MATTVKESSLGKEKTRSSPSTPQNQDSPRGKRASKSFNPYSSEKGLSIQKDKSTTPHYLKHTVSSAKDVCKYGKKQASDDTNLKYSSSRRRSIEQSPPPQSTLKRTLSANTRGTTTPSVKPPSSSSSSVTKNAVTNKNVSGKTSRSLSSGKSQPVLTRPVSIKKSKISNSTTTSKKEAKSKISNAQKNSSKSDVTEKQQDIMKPDEEEDKDASAQDIVGEEEPITITTEEGTQDEIQQTHDQMEPESTNPEDEKPNDACDSSSLSEEKEVNSNDPIEEQEEEKGSEIPENDKSQQGDEAQDKVKKEISSENEEAGKDDNGSEVESKNGEELMEKLRIEAEKVAPLEDGSDGNTTPHKVNFRKGKESEKMEADGGSQKLKFKVRAEKTEGNVEAKPEQDNVVLKRQDVQGKKESPAYNDVIEETASKLVGKRKSKVKALVGAFETVISLENENPQTEDT